VLKAGLTPFWVRWYERQGLLGPVSRSRGAQRRLSDEQVDRLEQISRWRRLGLGLRDIRALLDVPRPGGPEDLTLRLLARVDELQRGVGGVAALATAVAERAEKRAQAASPAHESEPRRVSLRLGAPPIDPARQISQTGETPRAVAS